MDILGGVGGGGGTLNETLIVVRSNFVVLLTSVSGQSPTPLWLVPIIVLSLILLLSLLSGVFVFYYVFTRRCNGADVSVDDCMGNGH